MLKRFVRVTLLMVLFVLLSAFVGVVQSQSVELPPLTEPGPYGVRIQKMTFVDESRDNWELEAFIWYPADKTQGEPSMSGSLVLRDAPPDRSGAPYPLILYSHSWLGSSAQFNKAVEQLASYGFVVAAPQHHDTDPPIHELVDRPLDIMRVLDGLAEITEGDFAGMIDTNNVGLMGYQLGGTTALQLLGLERDPAFFAAWCAEHPDLRTWDCNPKHSGGSWPFEEITTYRDQLGLGNLPDGSWAPFGDDRIRAVLVLDSWGFPLTTEDMLEGVITPTMVIQGTHNASGDYEGNAVRTYTHLGTEDRYLITMVNGLGDTFYSQQNVPQHFGTAFFGRYLKEDETFAPYLTPEGLPDWGHPELAWGPYEGD